MMDKILLTHARRYPGMTPRDAVKLLYQRSFGGGHLIRNEAACLEYLHREYAATPQTDAPLLEDIGNGMVRVSLCALDAHGYTPAQLGQDFIRSAAAVTGSTEAFEKDLVLLAELTRAGKMPFSSAELEEYLAQYTKAGYPAVSHSETYRNTYRPAYRVLQRCQLPQKIQKQV